MATWDDEVMNGAMQRVGTKMRAWGCWGREGGSEAGGEGDNAAPQL
jgi:hypothetical protein